MAAGVTRGVTTTRPRQPVDAKSHAAHTPFTTPHKEAVTVVAVVVAAVVLVVVVVRGSLSY